VRSILGLRFFNVVLLIILGGAANAAPSATSLTIQYKDLPQLVSEKNKNIEAARYMERAAKARTGYFVRSFLPELSAETGTESFTTTTRDAQKASFWKLETTINVFNGGKDHLEEKSRRASYRLASLDSKVTYHQEIAKAKKAYWELVALHVLLEHQREDIKENTRYISSAKRRTGAGLATQSDTLQFELYQTTLEAEVKRNEIELDVARAELLAMIGLSGQPVELADKDFPKPTLDELKIDSFGADGVSIPIQRLKEAEAVATAEYKKESRWWVPKLDVYTSYALPQLSDEYDRALFQEKEFALGFKVTLDLAAGIGGLHDAQAKAFQAKAIAARNQHESLQLTSRFDSLRRETMRLADLLKTADQDAEKATRLLRLTYQEYSRGAKNGPDLLGAFREHEGFVERRISLYKEFHNHLAEMQALRAAATENLYNGF
jgi:outer membrane protein